MMRVLFYISDFETKKISSKSHHLECCCAVEKSFVLPVADDNIMEKEVHLSIVSFFKTMHERMGDWERYRALIHTIKWIKSSIISPYVCVSVLLCIALKKLLAILQIRSDYMERILVCVVHTRFSCAKKMKKNTRCTRIISCRAL